MAAGCVVEDDALDPDALELDDDTPGSLTVEDADDEDPGPSEPADPHANDERVEGVVPGDLVEVEDGIVLPVPAPGEMIAIEVIYEDGQTATAALVHDVEGSVRIRHPDDHLVAIPEGTAAACAAKCSDNTYSYLFGAGIPAKWQSTLNWRYRDGGRPSGTKTAAIDGFKHGAGAVPSSRNSCSLADQVSATQSYKGETNVQPSPKVVNGALTCDEALLDDATNVVGWRSMTSNNLATTCTRGVSLGGGNFAITKMDMSFNKDKAWYFENAVPGGCSSAFSLRGVATHEFGHAYGLGHATQCNLTMSPAASPCSSANRQFGKGDVLGLRSLY